MSVLLNHFSDLIVDISTTTIMDKNKQDDIPPQQTNEQATEIVFEDCTETKSKRNRPSRKKRKDYARNSIFKIILIKPNGKEKEFWFCKNRLARQSGPLRALIGNGMKETHEGCAVLHDVDPRTLALFAHYVKTGNLSALSKTHPEAPCLFGVEPKNKDYYIHSDRIPSSFVTQLSGDVDNDVSFIPDYIDLYLFADMYDIQELKRRVTISLAIHLEDVDVHDPTALEVEELVSLVRFIYDNTPERSSDELRFMISRLCACYIRSLMYFEEFGELQNEGGAFAMDLMKAVIHLDDNRLTEELNEQVWEFKAKRESYDSSEDGWNFDGCPCCL